MLLSTGRFFSSSAAAGPPPVVTTYRYWRILVTATAGAQVTDWREVEFLLATVDQTGSGTASSSSSFSGSFLPANAFDNNGSTRWLSSAAPSTGTPQWLKYDFGSATTIDQVSITPDAVARGPMDFKIQGSDDDSLWADVATFVGVATWTIGGKRTFPLTWTDYLYWQILVTANVGAAACEYQEVEFLIGGVDQTGGSGEAYASSTSGADLPPRAFDNNTGTDWSSSVIPSGGTPVSLTYNFVTAGKDIDQISITPGTSTNRAPQDFKVRKSNDGTNWTDVTTFSGVSSGWTVGTKRTFTL